MYKENMSRICELYFFQEYVYFIFFQEYVYFVFVTILCCYVQRSL